MISHLFSPFSRSDDDWGEKMKIVSSSFPMSSWTEWEWLTWLSRYIICGFHKWRKKRRKQCFCLFIRLSLCRRCACYNEWVRLSENVFSAKRSRRASNVNVDLFSSFTSVEQKTACNNFPLRNVDISFLSGPNEIDLTAKDLIPHPLLTETVSYTADSRYR